MNSKYYLKFSLRDKKHVFEYLAHHRVFETSFYYYKKVTNWISSFKTEGRPATGHCLENTDNELARYLRAICSFDPFNIINYGNCTFEEIHAMHCKIIREICK